LNGCGKYLSIGKPQAASHAILGDGRDLFLLPHAEMPEPPMEISWPVYNDFFKA
jgi:hypothetical protein